MPQSYIERPHTRKALEKVFGIEIPDSYNFDYRELLGLLPPRKFTTSERTKKVLLDVLK